MTIYERVEKLAKQRGLSVNKVQQDLHFGNSIIYKWDGTTVPRLDTLLQVADYFGVSLDYLLSRTESPTISSCEYQKETGQIIQYLTGMQLTPKDANFILDFLKAFYKHQNC